MHQFGKLAVILHADIADSTRLVQRDERLAHDRIQEAFQRFGKTITQYHGQVREIRGDALLAEFDRASDAVTAALAFQSIHKDYLSQLNDNIVPNIRIGIAMGEVIVADNTVTGSGVVLAQRVEQLATSGGVCITAALQEALPKRMPFKRVSLGEQTLKGFDESVRVYQVELIAGESIPAPQNNAKTHSKSKSKKLILFLSAMVFLLVGGGLSWYQLSTPSDDATTIENGSEVIADQPSIAVLPFANLSGDPQHEYFSDGISEDIITDLSRLSNLAVIARNSTFTYKNTSAKAQDIGKDLGAKYLLEGSVRRIGNRIRITAKLIDASSGHHLWAERYDRLDTDIFELQDDITGKIISALSIELKDGESVFLSEQPTNSFAAYDSFLKAQQFYHQSTLEGLEQAVVLYKEAIELDPGFARAYGALGITLGRQFQRSFTDARQEEYFSQMRELVEKGVAIEPTSAHAQFALGFVSLMEHRFDVAIEAVEKTVVLSPNYAEGWLLLAAINGNLGRGDQALRFTHKAQALNPHYTWNYSFNEGRAHYFMNNYEEAIKFFNESLTQNENALFPRIYLTASYVQLGETEEVEWQVAELEIMNSGISLSALKEQAPLADGPHKDRLFNDLKIAGIPE